MGHTDSESAPHDQAVPPSTRQECTGGLTVNRLQGQSVYTELSTDEIRLLKVSPGVDEELIHAELEVVSLKDPPPYRAVSYHWGSSVCSKSITLNRQTVSVTDNLFAALRRFRSKAQTTYLWADSICINQKNDRDVWSQINAMATIYRKAEAVFIWLGEHKPSHALASWMVTWLFRYGSIHEEVSRAYLFSLTFLTKAFQQALIDAKDQFTCSCCNELCRFTWKTQSVAQRLQEGMEAMKELLSASWFERLWVLQENAVSQFSVFHFGRHRATWNLLSVAILVCDGYAYCETPLARHEQDIFHHAAQIEGVVTQYCGSIKATDSARSTQCLLDLLVNTWNFKASKDEDRLHSIRALAFIDHESIFQSGDQLSLSDWWVWVSCYILNGRGAWDSKKIYGPPVCRSILLTLAGLQNGRRRNDLPSWVPDMKMLDRSSFRKYCYNVVNCRDNRAGGRGRSFRVDTKTTHGILYVHAVVLSQVTVTKPGSQYWVDREIDAAADYGFRGMLDYDHGLMDEAVRARSVSSQQTPLPDMSAWEIRYWKEVHERLVPWYVLCYDFAYEVAHRPAEGETKRSDLSTIMTQGCNFNVSAARSDMESYSERREVMLARISQCFNDLRRHRDVDANPMPQPEQFYDDMIMFLHPQLFPLDLRLDVARILARTSDGRFGWVPEHAQEGDVVCLLEGAPEPYVLRPVDGGMYTLIGDAYIHGIMQGEAWPNEIEMNDDFVIGIK